MNCILNVTDHEYDKILQLNHDALVWNTADRTLLEGLETLLGSDTVAEIRQYDECRMQKHDDLTGLPRVEAAPVFVESHSFSHA